MENTKETSKTMLQCYLTITKYIKILKPTRHRQWRSEAAPNGKKWPRQMHQWQSLASINTKLFQNILNRDKCHIKSNKIRESKKVCRKTFSARPTIAGDETHHTYLFYLYKRKERENEITKIGGGRSIRTFPARSRFSSGVGSGLIVLDLPSKWDKGEPFSASLFQIWLTMTYV